MLPTSTRRLREFGTPELLGGFEARPDDELTAVGQRGARPWSAVPGIRGIAWDEAHFLRTLQVPLDARNVHA